MIKIIKEPENLGPPYEKCCFCNDPTPYWSLNNDVPVCILCSQHKNESDLPTKEEYMNQLDEESESED
jgi:hypothetical protein